jgi:hypothetical protein
MLALFISSAGFNFSFGFVPCRRRYRHREPISAALLEDTQRRASECQNVDSLEIAQMVIESLNGRGIDKSVW